MRTIAGAASVGLGDEVVCIREEWGDREMAEGVLG